MAAFLAPTPSPTDAMAALGAAAGRIPGILTDVAAAGTAAVPHGEVPTGLAKVTAAPTGAATPAVPGSIVAPGGGSDPAHVAAIAGSVSKQLGGVATGAASMIASDFGATALAPTEPAVALPQTPMKADVEGLPAAPVTPALEPEVARELISARGPAVQAALTKASTEVENAGRGHDAEAAAHTATANTTIQSEQRTATAAQTDERAATSTAVSERRDTTQAGNAAIVTEFSGTANALASSAGGEISTRMGQARSQADAELAANGAGAPVQRSWWSDARDAVSGAVSSVVSAVRDRVKGLLDAAQAFVRDRIRAFADQIAAAARATTARLVAAARDAGAWMRERVRAGLLRINALARRLATAVAGVVTRLRARISALASALKAKLIAAWRAAGAVVKKVLEAAEAVRTFLRMMADNALSALISIVRDPMAAVEKAKDVVGGMVAKVPGLLEGVLAEHVAPRLGGTSAPVGNAVPVVQRQETDVDEDVAEPTHWDGVKDHLATRTDYLRANWWEVIKDGLFEALVPGVAVYRHLPTMWDEVVQSWNEFKAGGRASEGWDHVLGVCRELMAIVASVVAQASLVVFIIVSVFGTPVAGEAALVSLGLAVIEVDLAVQVLTILKSASNLSGRSPVPVPQDENETDYGRIADSSIAGALMMALLLLGAGATAAVKALLRRFPALGRALSAVGRRVRKVVRGHKPVDPPPAKPKTRTTVPAEEEKKGGPRVDDENADSRGKGGAEERIPEGVTDDDVHIEDGHEPSRAGEPELDVGLCFAAGTPVATPTGPRVIEDIRAGERVFAFDLGTGRVAAQRVLGITRGATTRWVEVGFGSETVRATPGHPFLDGATGTWTKADELRPGMTLLRRDGGATVVRSVIRVDLDEPETTYNFGVEDVECYFVGALAVLVHNITNTRLKYLRRTGYRNYVLTDGTGKIYYSGMCRESETAAGLMRRHSANGNRFNFANGDRVVFEAGIREYFEARLMELRTALKNGLVIGRNSPLGRRGNIQRPMAQVKEAEYRQAELRKSNCG